MQQAGSATPASSAGATRYEKVRAVISSEKQQRLVHLTLSTGKKLTATEGHPFRTTEGWRDAILLKKGGKLLLKGSGDDGDDAPKTAAIADIQIELKTLKVFNLSVENLRTFFVGEEGLVVHNASGVYIDEETYDQKTGPYVGQSKDMDKRYKEHGRNKRKKGRSRICSVPGIDDPKDRTIVENFMFDTLKDWFSTVTNKIRPLKVK